MTSGRWVVTSETKVNVTLGLLVAVLVAMLTASWHVAGWKREMEMRVNRLEDDKCPCGQFFQANPPRVER